MADQGETAGAGEPAAADKPPVNRWVAIGIGSAALVAALLYANGARKAAKDKRGG